METKFTKGEWINLGYRVDVDVADGLSGICEMSDWMPEEEMNANAKLIAAAPDLFNETVKSLKFLEWIASQSKDYNMWSDKVQELHKLIAKAREVIYKATE